MGSTGLRGWLRPAERRVHEHSFLQPDAEALQGALQMAVRVERNGRYSSIKTLIQGFPLDFRTRSRTPAGRCWIAEHVSIADADHPPAPAIWPNRSRQRDG